MKKYLVEFIGTFFLVLTVVMTANNGSGNMAPFAVGCALTVMIYAGGHISGGHFNPAVTIALLVNRRMDKAAVPLYLVSQLLGAVMAAVVAVFLLQCTKSMEINFRHNEIVCAIIAEFLGTFALIWVILNTYSHTNKEHPFAGLAIGLTMMASMYGLGVVSGGAFNIATAIGMAVSGMVAWGDLWMYVFGIGLGAAASASIYSVVHED